MIDLRFILNYASAVECRPLHNDHEATSTDVAPGYDYSFINDDLCDGESVTYNVYHQDHYSGQLKLINTSKEYIHTIHNIQLNNSGVYCTHKSCSATAFDSCCIQIQSKV